MEDLVKRYLKSCQINGNTEGTIANYSNSLATFLEWRAENVPSLTPQELNAEYLEEYTHYLLDRDFAISTINVRLGILNSFLSHLKTRHLCPYEIKAKPIRAREIALEPFSDEQLTELYDCCLMRKSLDRIRDYVFMRTLEETGMRLGECLDLKVDEIDFRNSVIQLRFTKNRKIRNVYLTPLMKQELQTYIDARNKFLAKKKIKSDALWITTRTGHTGQCLTRSVLQKRISAYGAMAGIDIRVSPHTFRHTFARNWIVAGGDMLVLKDLLGHSTLDMVLRYVKLWDNDRQNIYESVMATRTKKSTVKKFAKSIKSS